MSQNVTFTLSVTPAEHRAIRALLAGANRQSAAREAGVSRMSLHRWMKSEHFQREYTLAREQLHSQSLQNRKSATDKAVAVLDRLLSAEGEDNKTVLRAAIALAFQGGTDLR